MKEGEIMELFRLFGTVALRDNEAQQGLDNIDNRAQQTGNKLGVLGRMGGFVGTAIAAGAAAAVAGIGLLTGAIAKTGLAYNMAAEQSQVAWTTLLGTQGEAKKMLEDIGNFAKKTQFGTEEVDMMAKYMHNAGIEGKALFDELTKVADVAGAFNIPAAEAKELTRQMSQVRQAGVAYTEDLNVLQDRGVPIYKAISEQLGITVGDVKKMASEGKLTSDIYLSAFDSIAKGVEGSAEAQSKTMSGMLSALKDNLSMISGELTKGLFEKLKGALDKVMPIVERFSDTLKDEGLKSAILELIPQSILDKIQSFKDFIKQAIEQVSPMLETFKSSFQSLFDSIGPIWESLKTLFESLRPILEPLALFVAGTLVVAFGLAISIFNGVIAAIGPLVQAFINFMDVVVNVVKSIIQFLAGDFDGAMKSWNKATESSIEFFKNLWEGVKAFFKGFLDTTIGYLKSWGVYEEVSSTFNKVRDAISEKIEKAKELVRRAIEDIKGFFSGLSLKLPDIKTPHFKLKNWSINPLDWVKNMPSIGIDWYAMGTNFAPGGLAMVGERGPELVNLPRGSKVNTANQTRNILNNQAETKQPAIIQVVTPDKRTLAEWLVDDITEYQELNLEIKSVFKG
jgi:tape measure domain-containing protein